MVHFLAHHVPCDITDVEVLCCSQVLEVLAAVRNEDATQLAETVYRNTCNLFRFS